jgi:hypothetical protein
MNQQLCECGHSKGFHHRADGVNVESLLYSCFIMDCGCQKFKPEESN